MRINFASVLWIVTLVFVVGLTTVKAAITGPYAVDGNTLHLWHLDDAAAPALDAVAGPNNLPMQGLLGGATLGNSSYSGFGTALSTFDSGPNGSGNVSPAVLSGNFVVGDRDAMLLAAPVLSPVGNNTANNSDNVPFSHANPVTGAFTFEAVLRVDFDPTLNMGAAPTVAQPNNLGNGRIVPMQIFSMEDENNAGRIFQFRYVPVGIASGASDSTKPRIDFTNVRQAAGGQVQSIVVEVPTTGPNAISQGDWFHVAAAYNGNENTADNISFYWTKLDPSATAANLIGTAQLANDLAAASGDFCIGNWGRSIASNNTPEAPAYNFVGLIDEVRISDTARSANQFIFAVPEPSAFVSTTIVSLICLAGLRHCRRCSKN